MDQEFIDLRIFILWMSHSTAFSTAWTFGLRDPRTYQDCIKEYRMGGTDPILLLGLPPVIAFTTPDEYEFPVRYLALHTACARVAYLSGAGEYTAKILRDIETIGVLSKDGSSDVLYHVLVRSMNVEVY
ncbi:hypothetical protein CVT25_007192 [Psilocybe cyanescens]|uniref:HNH nuclease domain-containing protein n=1 Tax=Psilocybe cyanescens TaxID=93625 RepID=A0A409WVL6_PSICY|nr:hypothetical protein CVT25_007192 [Psilocybe cyanescens]